MKLQCNRERRGGERSCVYQCACSAHTTLTHSLAHTHTHAACMCSADHVVLMDFQRDRISRGKVAAQCKTEKKKEKVLRCHVGDRIKHKRTHTKLWRNVVSLCSFSHVCESIYHFFFISHFKLYRMCDLCSDGVDSNNACFSFCSGCSKRKTSGKNREIIERKKSTVVG